MAEVTPEKMAAQEEAARRTENERQRIENYRSLRFDFSACNIEYWIDTQYKQQEQVYKAKKDPSWNQVRKEASIGFFENALACTSTLAFSSPLPRIFTNSLPLVRPAATNSSIPILVRFFVSASF